MTHIVVDIETLGLKPGSVILEIGAAAFVAGQQGPITNTFNVTIAPFKSVSDLGASVESRTNDWWCREHRNKYDDLMRDCTTDNNSPADALYQFKNWTNLFNGPKVFWGNGPEFDMVLLQWYFEQANRIDARIGNLPWHYSEVASLRSLKALAPDFDPKEIVNPNPHRAGSDALYEAQVLQAYINTRIR